MNDDAMKQLLRASAQAAIVSQDLKDFGREASALGASLTKGLTSPILRGV